LGLEEHEKKIYFISVNLRFLQSATATLLLAALNSLQKTGAAAKPEAKPPMGHGRGRVGEKGKASGRGSERQKGGRPWEKRFGGISNEYPRKGEQKIFYCESIIHSNNT